MKLGHLSILIVVIIAVIVAAIITAFSLVTFASLDKAVDNSLSSEAEYIRSTIQGIEESAKSSVKVGRDRLISENWTIPNLPWQDYIQDEETVPQPQYSNWTKAIEFMVSTINHNRQFHHFYLTGPTPITSAGSFWVLFNVRQADLSTSSSNTIAVSGDKFNYPTIQIPELSSGRNLVIDGRSPLSFKNIWRGKARTYVPVTNLIALDVAGATPEGGVWGRAKVTYSIDLFFGVIVMSYHLPIEFDSATGKATTYLSIDVNTEALRDTLHKSATKDNTLVLIDLRNSSQGDGTIIATSKPQDELAIYDTTAGKLWTYQNSPNAEVNSIVQNVVEYYGGFAKLRSSSRDAIITDAGDLVIAASHVIGEGNLHFMIVSAIPKEYYFGSTATTIAATIGAGVGFLILASGIILLIMFEQQKLVEGSKQSVRIAESVARDLVLYNTDQAHESLTHALTSETLIDENGEKEEPNYTNKDLIGALKAINENLKMYAPFLPEYILKGDEGDLSTTGDSIRVEMPTAGDDSQTSAHGLTQSGNIRSMVDSSKTNPTVNSMNNSAMGNSSKSNNNSMNQHPAMQSSGMIDLTSRSRHSSSANQKYNSSANLADMQSQHSHTTSASARKSSKPVVSVVSRLRNRGDFVERLVLCNLSLSKLASSLLPLSSSDSSPVQLKQINRVVEILLDTASANNATIHSLVGDSLQVTVSAVSRTGHADVKALRFLTTCDALIKKEFSDWTKEDHHHQNHRLSLIAPNQMLITGAVVNSRGYCGVFGNDKRQQFLMFGFSDSDLMSSMHDLAVKNNMLLCCRTIQQNTNYENEFRGAGVIDVSTQDMLTQQKQEQQQQKTPSSSATTHPIAATSVKTAIISHPIYELVHRKNLGNANSDEWLYVVGENDNNSDRSVLQKINQKLSSATVQLVKGNSDKVLQLLAEVKELDAESCELAAYRNMEKSLGKNY